MKQKTSIWLQWSHLANDDPKPKSCHNLRGTYLHSWLYHITHSTPCFTVVNKVGTSLAHEFVPS
jgi:hypothetical protein